MRNNSFHVVVILLIGVINETASQNPFRITHQLKIESGSKIEDSSFIYGTGLSENSHVDQILNKIMRVPIHEALFRGHYIIVDEFKIVHRNTAAPNQRPLSSISRVFSACWFWNTNTQNAAQHGDHRDRAF